MSALFEYISVGDHIVIPTGLESEVQLMRDTRANLEHVEVTKTDGSASVIIEGKFNDCNGPVDVKVCLIFKKSIYI